MINRPFYVSKAVATNYGSYMCRMCCIVLVFKPIKSGNKQHLKHILRFIRTKRNAIKNEKNR